MSEVEFIQSIECRFPYRDRSRALELAETACLISPNAVFAVADEVSRPPHGEITDPETCSDVLNYLSAHIQHPLAEPVLGLAHTLVAGKSVNVGDAVRVLRQIEPFPGQYAALSIAYFAPDDIDGVADAEYNRIRAVWDAP